MRKVEIQIDGDITLAELDKMAESIGCTVHSAPGGRLTITSQPAFGLSNYNVHPIRPRTRNNVIPLRGNR